jgi:hypothetical protein
MGMAEALDRKPQGVVLALDREHSAHNVSLGRPEVQEALTVLAGYGIPGGGEVECDYPILQNDGMARSGEKFTQGTNERLSVHGLDSFNRLPSGL